MTITVPKLALHDLVFNRPRPSTRRYQKAVNRCQKALEVPPYAVRITGLGGADASDYARQFLETVAGAYKQALSGKGVRLPEGQSRTSFTTVTPKDINPAGKTSTSYSRTRDALDLHTDSSYHDHPEDIVAFLMVNGDSGDTGLSTVATIDSITASLTAGQLSVLRRHDFPFGTTQRPVLFTHNGETAIRYYRTQIAHSADRQKAVLAPEQQDAMDAVDAALQNPDSTDTFKLHNGEMLVLNNHRALHGRTALAPQSTREMHRFRLRITATDTAQSDDAVDTVNTGTLLRRLKTAIRSADRKAARTAADQLAARVDQSYTGASELGRAYFKLGQFEKAQLWLERSLDQNPNQYFVLLDLSAIYARQNRPVSAQSLMFRAANLRPVLIPKAPQNKAPQNGAPSVAVFRSLSDSLFGVKTNRKTKLRIRGHKGGHFALTHLFDQSDWHSVTVNLVKDSSLRPQDIPDCDIWLNTVACGDRQRDTLATFAAMTAHMDDRKIINPPAKVLKTARANNAARLRAINGVEVADIATLTRTGGDTDFARHILDAGFDYPYLIREVGTQTGKSLAKIDRPADLAAYLQDPERLAPVYHIQSYMDCRGANGLYTKYRCFFIDRKFYPIARLSNDIWQIHSGDRYRVMDKRPDTQDEEALYLKDPHGYLGRKTVAVLESICAAIDLDYFGIDFTASEDGKVQVFEANPAMRHNYDHVGAFPYTRPTLDAATDAFQIMVSKRAGR